MSSGKKQLQSNLHTLSENFNILRRTDVEREQDWKRIKVGQTQKEERLATVWEQAQECGTKCGALLLMREQEIV